MQKPAGEAPCKEWRLSTVVHGSEPQIRGLIFRAFDINLYSLPRCERFCDAAMGAKTRNMTVSMTRLVTNDERELRKKLKELEKIEAELVQNELDLATMTAELRALDLLYMRKVGIRLTQLDLLDARIAELLARLNPEDRSAEKRAKEARKLADEAEEEVREAQAEPEENTRFQPSESLRQLYRECAKLMHPDLACDDTDRDNRNRWMVEINAAFQAGDEERLRKLVEAWSASPESVQGSGTNADLERTLRKIAHTHERINAIKNELERLRHTFAYTLKMRIRAAYKDGRDLLEEMAAKIEKQVNAKQSLLDDLLKNFPNG